MVLTAALAFVLIYILIYCMIPNIWSRNFSKNVLRIANTAAPEIILTFDDGPNPEHTPMVLNILRHHDVKATFFVVGKKARLYPDIVKQIQADGHEIGVHSFLHFHSWLLLPFAVFSDFTKCCSEVSKIIDQKPIWYRPPWGTFNLLTLYAARKNGLKTVLWSVTSFDWQANNSAACISATITSKVRPGAIIVMHDDNGKHNKHNKTVEALPTVIDSLHQQGYKFVLISRRGGK